MEIYVLEEELMEAKIQCRKRKQSTKLILDMFEAWIVSDYIYARMRFGLQSKAWML